MTPPEVDMRSVRRVLIIKLSALGDIIHALPVSAALKDSFPHVELTWAVEEAYVPLISGNPCVKDIAALPRGRGRQLRSPAFLRDYLRRLRDLRQRRFDVTIDLQALTKSAAIAAVTGAPVRLAYHWLREAAGLFERAVPRKPASVHIVDQYLDVARYLGATADSPRFPFHIPAEDELAVDAMLNHQKLDDKRPFITINPASAIAIKQWSAIKYGALIDRLYRQSGIQSVLVTADKEVAGKVAAAATAPLVNLAGHTNLKQLAAVLRRGAVHISGDTGSGHLAAALQKPVIALLGPSDPNRSAPYGQQGNAIRLQELCGATCGLRHCEFAYPKCLEALTVDRVAAQVDRLLLS